MSPGDRENAEHYVWQSAIGPEYCDGWHLHRSSMLSVIEERMPPETAEQRHLHRHAAQFFYVLAGELLIESDGEEQRLAAGTGISIPPNTPHRIFNRGPEITRFLVVSHPPSHGDRIPAPPTTEWASIQSQNE